MTINKRGNPNWKKGGASPNPTGRPKDGESWAAIIKAVGDMYPADLVSFLGKDNDLGRMLSKLPQGVQMKYLVTARVFASLMFEPTNGLWKELMERSEGKVKGELDITSDDKPLKVIFEYSENTNTETTQSAGDNQDPAQEA